MIKMHVKTINIIEALLIKPANKKKKKKEMLLITKFLELLGFLRISPSGYILLKIKVIYQAS